jgi:hypothetical protein
MVNSAAAASSCVKIPRDLLPGQHSAFTFLEQVRLMANGKMDCKTRPVPEGERLETKPPFIAPRTPLEQVLA